MSENQGDVEKTEDSTGVERKEERQEEINWEIETEKAREEAKLNYDKYIRAVADLENYRKRTLKEKDEIISLAKEYLVLKLVDVLDNFDRAVAAAKTSADFDSFHRGVELICKQLTQILEREGLKAYSAKGEKFDPQRHEAILTVETDNFPPDTVVDEISKGYIFRDKVVRPALVTVSKGVESVKELSVVPPNDIGEHDVGKEIDESSREFRENKESSDEK